MEQAEKTNNTSATSAFVEQQQSEDTPTGKSIGAFFKEARSSISKATNEIASVFKAEESQQFNANADPHLMPEPEEEIDSMNPAMIAAHATTFRPLQNKPYCQICLKDFSLLSRKYNCFYCTRSCCKDCSKEMANDVSVDDKILTCEYCQIKLENPQIEQFY